MAINTLPKALLNMVEKQPNRIAMRRKDYGIWHDITWTEYLENVKCVTLGLHALGVKYGEHIAIIGENRPEWLYSALGIVCAGGAWVGVYTTNPVLECEYVVGHSDAVVYICEDEEQLDKALVFRDKTPKLRKLIVWEMEGLKHYEDPMLMSFDQLLELGKEEDRKNPGLFLQLTDLAKPQDIAGIIYTSGTTGEPKGAMLTHGNMASNVACSMEAFGFGTKEEVSVSFLPLSHVTARHVDFALLYLGVALAYCPDIAQLVQALAEVQPDIFVAVPRVYEKIRQQVILKAAGFPKSSVYRWALSVGRAHRAETLAGAAPTALSWKIANRLVFSKVLAGIGGIAHEFISGGAPLGRELVEWYADIGIPIHEGYGLTETSPVIAVNTPLAHKLGTVGKPLPNVEVQIASDGEVLVRGPSVFKGYWKRPEATRDAFVDGWFKTGDIGHLDSEGFLSITDRKKDLIKTSGGKFIAPQPIENSLKLNPLIGTAVVFGDRRKFPAVLIAPHFPALEDWARANQIEFGSREALVANAKVRALYEGIIEDLNQNLARFEKLKRVLVVPEELSAGWNADAYIQSATAGNRGAIPVID